MQETLRKIVEETFGGFENPEQIADLCRREQIQGFINNSVSCPMAKLIRSKVEFNVGFSLEKKGLWWCWSFGHQDYSCIPASTLCEQFSEKFDSGGYPDLIAFKN